MKHLVPASPLTRRRQHPLLACALFLACASSAQTASAQAVLDYAGRWTFDDCGAVGSDLKDSSGNNATATRGSSVFCSTDADGRANGAVNLLISQPGNGTPATTVNISNTTAFPLTTTMSVSAKIKPGSVPGGAIVTKGWTNAAGVAQKTFQLAIVKDANGIDRLKFTMWARTLDASPTSNGIALSIMSPATMPILPSVWTQVGASFDPQKGLQLFINGVVVNNPIQLFATIADAPAGTPSTMWLGGGAPSQTLGYTGAIDDLWISKGSCADLQSSRVASTPQELMVTNLGVVNDPVRTVGMGAWTFGHLVEQMVPANASLDAASDMVEAMFKSFDTDQVINKQTVKARTSKAEALVLTNWPRLANGKLDLSKAPLRLLAIANRMDLRDLSKGDAGEGRFIFGVLNKDGVATSFTVIMEYKLPAQTPADIRVWARDWHALGNLAVGTPAYNAALQSITDRFASRGAAPKRFNGSAISQVRTNEIALGSPWELRQFELNANPTTGATNLIPSPIAMTPGNVFKSLTGFLTPFINEHAASILDGTYTIPLTTTINGNLQLAFFQGASALNDSTPWNAQDIVAPTSLLRHTLAVNTCNGCHSFNETGTGFLHVSTRSATTESRLSGFLKGITGVRDPVDGVTLRNFNDLARRQVDMNTVLLTCPAPVTAAAATTTTLSTARALSTTSTTSTTTPTTTTSATSLTKGINRTH